MNIAFVLLPLNSTDKCQPLDVSFFAPLKREWRKLLELFKQKNHSSTLLDKSMFPRMLKQLLNAMNEGERASTNLISGFRTCGIYTHWMLKKCVRNSHIPVPPTLTLRLNHFHRLSQMQSLSIYSISNILHGAHYYKKKKKIVGVAGKIYQCGGSTTQLSSILLRYY